MKGSDDVRGTTRNFPPRLPSIAAADAKGQKFVSPHQILIDNYSGSKLKQSIFVVPFSRLPLKTEHINGLLFLRLELLSEPK